MTISTDGSSDAMKVVYEITFDLQILLDSESSEDRFGYNMVQITLNNVLQKIFLLVLARLT